MPIELNLIPVDDDDDLSNNYQVATDQGFYTPDDLNNLNFYVKHLNQAEREGASGTGLFSPFLRMNGDATLQGFNTSAEINNGTQNANHLDIDFSGDNSEGGSGHTVAFRLGDVPIIYLDLNEDGTTEAYYQINLDINENNNTDVSLEELQIYTSTDVATLADYQLGGATDASNKGDAFLAADGFIKRFDLDANGDAELTLNDDSAGQGGNDYYFFIPLSAFAGAAPTDFFTLYSQFGPTPADDAGFAEWNTLLAAQINGVKFNDHDGNGVQDVGVDEALPGFTVYIDHNNNNLLDIDEQYTQSDANGEFTFYSLLGNTNYTIREVLSLADLSAGLKAVLSDAQEAALLPPPGVWDQTTDPNDDGDQVVAVTSPTNEYFVAIGNHELQPHVAIVKEASVPGDCADALGELVSYTISVTNDGEVDLDTVVVTDDFADAAPVYDSGDDGDNVLICTES